MSKNKFQKNTNPKDISIIDKSIQRGKEVIADGEEFFAEEIEQVKETAKKWVEVAGSYTNQIVTWLKNNRQTIVWIILIAMWLYRLWSIVLWVLLVIFGVLFVVGYFKDIKSVKSVLKWKNNI